MMMEKPFLNNLNVCLLKPGRGEPTKVGQFSSVPGKLSQTGV